MELKHTYCIGILTFSKRKRYIEELIRQIRSQTDIPIYLCINCDYNQPFDNEYRNFILKLCLEHPDVYPSFYLKFRGLSKAWNDMVINSSYDNTIIINDDAKVEDGLFKEIIDIYEQSKDYRVLKINSGWACFIVNKKFLSKVGFFHEKLIGIGFEDSEFVRRNGEFPSHSTNKFIDLGSELESINSFPNNENATTQLEKVYTTINHQLYQSNQTDKISSRPFEQYYDDNYDKIFG